MACDTQFSPELAAELRRIEHENDGPALEALLAAHPEWEFSSDPSLHARLGVVTFKLNQQDLAYSHFSAIEEALLSTWAELSDYGFLCQVFGRIPEGLAALRRAVADPAADSAAYVRLGGLLYLTGDMDGAAEAFDNALLRDPERPEILNNLAAIAIQHKQFDEALVWLDRALALQPDLSTALSQRQACLLAMNQLDRLLEEAVERLEQHRDQAEAHINLAMVQAQCGDLAAAEATLAAAADDLPNDARIKEQYVGLMFRRQRWGAAGQALMHYLADAEHPLDDPLPFKLMLAQARIEAGFFAAAAEGLAEIAAESPDHPQLLLLQARLATEQSRPEEAIALLEEAIARYPGLVPAYMALAHALVSVGRLVEAQGHLHTAMAMSPQALVQYVENLDTPADDEQIAALRQMMDHPATLPEARAGCAFTLARALERRKEDEESFQVVIKANELVKAGLSYDWRTHRRLVRGCIEVFDEALVERFAGMGHPSHRPIFVLGMPRSGTTLTEQILASHPAVYGAGELGWVARLARLMPKVLSASADYPEVVRDLDADTLRQAADYYLQRIAAQNAEAERVVDKMPHNFDYLGLIALMFPNAAIIHLDREPRDVAVSNYYQNFSQSQGLMGFAFDLEWIGHMLNDHARLMQHWHRLFPGRIYELNYERLVADPEPVIRELLDHCRLPWDEGVLRFYETSRPVRTASIRQVRQGIYQTSSAKWRRYEAFLGPLEALLQAGFPEQAGPEERGADGRGVAPIGLAGFTRTN